MYHSHNARDAAIAVTGTVFAPSGLGEDVVVARCPVLGRTNAPVALLAPDATYPAGRTRVRVWDDSR
jgi:hypothetical protein